MATILLYVPDAHLAQKFAAFLQKDHTVQPCDAQVLPQIPKGERPLILMDARLKWTLCRPLLAHFQGLGCPILFLTGDRQMRDHLCALYAGRCDVLTLPFTRKALLHKVTDLAGDVVPPGELKVDASARVAMLDGRRVELTAQEFALLVALMEAPDEPVSREHLLRTAWGYQSMGETRTVDVHIQRLRKKLGEEYIETVYKCGYKLQGLRLCMA